MLSRALTQVVARAGFRFLAHLAQVLRQLWHEVIGTLFLALGAAAIPSMIKEWRGDSRTRLVMAGIFFVIMVYFGITSFLKARKAARNE